MSRRELLAMWDELSLPEWEIMLREGGVPPPGLSRAARRLAAEARAKLERTGVPRLSRREKRGQKGKGLE